MFPQTFTESAFAWIEGFRWYKIMQVDCFNHRVVTLVAYKERQWFLRGLLWCGRLIWYGITNALQSYVLQGTSMLSMQAGDSLTNVLRIVGVLWL